MKRLRQLAAVITCAVAGCAAPMTVSSHVGRDVDFARYRSFAWGPADALPTGDPRLDRNSFFNDHVQGAVERQLAARGMVLVTTGAPDLLMHYHAHISQRLDVNRADRRYGYCSEEDCPVDTIEYEAGTLVLDIIDARTSRLLWRGWARNSVEDMLDDPETMASTIEQAVARMLERLPRKL